MIENQERPMNKQIFVVGVAGGSGSGKTTLVNRLRDALKDNCVVVYHDDYYKSNKGLTMEEKAVINYDHPDAFETELMIRHIQQLKAGNAVECPIYDYTIHDRSKETKIVKPASVILIEGILILADERLRELMDLKIYVDAEDDERILRRIQRDVEERNRSMQSVIQQYLTTVKPMHKQYVEPSKERADVIVPRGGLNQVAYEMIYHEILQHVLVKEGL